MLRLLAELADTVAACMCNGSYYFLCTAPDRALTSCVFRKHFKGGVDLKKVALAAVVLANVALCLPSAPRDLYCLQRRCLKLVAGFTSHSADVEAGHAKLAHQASASSTDIRQPIASPANAKTLSDMIAGT